MGIDRLGCIEGTLREVVGHDGAVKHPLPAFARRNSREQKCQKVQKITGKITVVSCYDQPADGVLLHDFIGFILQSLGIDRFVDEAWILFQHGGKDLILALVSFPPADPLKLLQKVILPKRFIGAEIVIRQFRLLGEPISLVCLRAVVPAVRQIGRAELVTLNGNGGQKLIVQLGGLFRFLLTGLEIDSAKSGIRPDLDEYLTHKTVKRSAFLKYKTLVEDAETRRAWYEPTHAAKVKAFFKRVDWDAVDSNVERLPYLAQQLNKNTPRIKAKPARDEELFSFARQPGWKEQLNSDKLAAVDALLQDYDACLSRIRACRVPLKEKKRKSDVERILYARGQEDAYDPDELYALFGSLPPERVSALLHAMREQAWHLMDGDARERFLREWLPEPEFEDIYDLLTDFRLGGYRILGDIVCDMEDENTGREKKQLFRESDSKAFTAMMRAFADKSASRSYRDAVTAKCRELLTAIVRPALAVRYVVALGRRDLLWELLPEYIEKNVLEVWDD